MSSSFLHRSIPCWFAVVAVEAHVAGEIVLVFEHIFVDSPAWCAVDVVGEFRT
jgi:hypothetical protein